MKRCLILSCTDKKDESSRPIAALERYQGPAFKVLHKFLGEVHRSDSRIAQLDIYILSAKFGLISGQEQIPNYDQRMTKQRAAELRPTVVAEFKSQVASKPYDELFLLMGRTYLQALKGFEDCLVPATKVIISKGGSGQKLSELKAWLNAEANISSPSQLSLIEDTNNGHLFIPGTTRGIATIKGVTISLTPDEIYDNAQTALTTNTNNAFNYKNWYVQINDTRVSPKWLVQQLSGVPVNEFDASVARRFLTGLGIPIYRNQ